jgi:hypothetical protein
VSWQSADGSTFEDAKSSNKPIVLFFVDKDDEATRDAIRGPKVSPLSKEKANFVLVVKPTPVELPEATSETKVSGPTITSGGKAEKKSESSNDKPTADVAEVVKSPVPVSKLSAADLWASFEVSAANTVVLVDWLGNEKSRYARVPTESTLIRAIEGVAASVEADAKSLASDFEKLEKYTSGNDDGKSIKQAMKIFKRGLVGHDVIAKTEVHYTKLIENGKSKMAALEAAKDATGLRALKGAYRDTEIENHVSDALTRVQAKA